jgi:hypothetical protein
MAGAHHPESAPPHMAQSRFRAFRRCFEEAVARAGGESVHEFLVGERRVRLVFAGTALVPFLLPALEHLRAHAGSEAALTVRIWDSASTGVTLSADCGSLEEHALAAMPNAQPQGSVLSAFGRPDSGLSMLDMDTNEAIYWLPDAGAVPFEDRSAPLRGVLNWWMATHGRQFVHAAAVGTEAGAVLIVGRGGSGKSTTALACLSAGMRYVGDDYCLVGLERGPRAYSLYRTAKLYAHNLHRLPHMASALINESRLSFEKGVLVLGGQYDGSIVPQLPIRAVLVPTVKNKDQPLIQPASRAAALAAIAPSTLLQLSSTRAESMATLGALVRSVPAYSIELCRDVTRIPPAITGLLAELQSNA